jgi:2-C-methyl-D-erythritol 4-phosphate cytidylyltransferase
LRWAAVIVAAGRGTRFGRPKQLLEIAGLPMVGWSITTFAAMPEIAQLVIATEADLIKPMAEICKQLAPHHDTRVILGGATRQHSVYEGLRAVPDDCEAVLVHDGARPLVTPEDVRAGMREVRVGRAALLAASVVDTIKQVDRDSLRVAATLDRRSLWAAQTPQFARTSELRSAHEHALRDGVAATDDAALLERIGIAVIVVPSTSENFKVTHAPDIARAEALLRTRFASRHHPEATPCHPEPVEG